ncbi:cell wall metabolism sensor histidine kinase WalK [Clostridium celatum]|uniref:histidine kinase n=1 Tax=Clostridium celatum DSM 1785 TaxID=545697 RepID=L1QIV0_9CLOT|nr:ATP-binding protein [Clostridium celatum]EKY27512.1 ATPase/histidine kinase/DNA gyrase B/HSP90 domain protein [Clostridium celatum DSM 1785]MCE9655577.1 two-component sensor histidine kinase [Clostridium celatum]MDU2265964.1 ATP-binding protein [Clostridium celatum]MDU3723641.1 ATP-binding protein [Clostridium celatum]MDU6296198.1 ATP-binding protein [Clostridium celatum]
MFDKLKKKFILMNMVLLTTVFIGIFGTIYVMTAFSLNRDMEMQLRNSMNPMAKPPKGNMDVTITINLDSENKITNIVSRFDVSEWNTKQVIDEILSNNESLSKIKINGESYAYLKQNINGGIKIVLISRAYQQDVLANLLRIFILVGAISLIVLFLISIYFTNRTIEPLEESFKKQKQFIADASHELRTPLTIIKTNISLLEENKNETIKSQEKWIKYIDSQASRMSTLINEMLSLANLDAKRKNEEITSINLSKILNDLLLVFEVVIFEKGLLLEENISKDIFINGEKDQIKKLISILMDNAIKYTNSGGKITVNLNVDKTKTKLIVKNTGEGIAKEHLEKIFERFYRVDASRDRGTGGYGLGLSIAKSIVEDHKGKIYAESIIGESASFIVELPINNEKLKVDSNKLT